MSENPIHFVNNRSFDQASDTSGTIDIRRIWFIILRRWRILAGAVGIVVSLTIIAILQITPIYTATAQLLIDPRKTNAMKSEAIVSDLTLDMSTIATEVSLIKSFSVARRVVERLKLQDHAQFGRAPAKFSMWTWLFGSNQPDNSEITSENSTSEPTAALSISPALRALIRQVESGIDVRRVGNTYFIEVSYSHFDPKITAVLANAVTQSYLDEQLEARYQAAQHAAGWLSERVAALRVQLENSERALAEHRAKYNLVNKQAGTLADQQAAEINSQLVSARAQTVDKKAKFDQAQKILDGGASIESIAAVVDSPSIAALRTREADVVRQEADLLTRYGPEHPAILKIRAEHTDLNRQIKREVARVVQTLKTDYEFAQKKEQSLEGSLQELTSGQNLNDRPILRLRELERDAQSNRTLYETLLARFKEAEQQTSLDSAQSRIVAPAFIPISPSYPNKIRFLLLAVVGGIAVGSGAIYLLEYLENGFTSAEQIEQALHLPVLAIIPRLSENDRMIDGRIAPIPEYTIIRPQSRYGESIRSVRVSTQMSNVDKPPRLILVTSALPAEGKTTTALSMAFSAAASARQRVLLIDGDLRAKSVSKQFNLLDKTGLTDVLTEREKSDRAFFPTDVPNLTILPAGSHTGHPPDILGSERMCAFLQYLLELYDVIYLDAPPLLPVIDSVVLSRFVDKILLIVNWRQTPRNIVVRALQLIDTSKEKISGIVLNGANLDQLTSYDPYNTYYHKKYGTYYSQ